MEHKILKIGHRGAKAYLAENTIESINKALELGVDGIEIDVHQCASGELVVFHDFTLDRMTNGSGELAECTLSELKQLYILNKYRIPTLEEVLDNIGNDYLLNVELKGINTAKKACEIIMLYIQKFGWNYDNFIVSSFQHKELEEVFKIDKQVRLGVLTKASLMEAVEFAETINAYSIHPNYALVTSKNLKLAKEKGYKVFVWTVNMKDTIKRMQAYGVDGIISDAPDRL